MTKQQKTEYVPQGKAVHVTPQRIVTDAVYADAVSAALIEQLYEIKGSASIARFLAECLRKPSPDRAVLDMVASWLDPQTDDYIKLVVVGRRRGKRMTKRVNDAAIAKAVMKNMEARGNKHGDQKKAVKEVAKQFEVSKATVLKALRSK